MNTKAVAEEWLPVVGHEPFYSVSNLGRVMRHERVVTSSARSTYVMRAKILSPGVSRKSRYLSIRLTDNTSTTTHYIHHLVLCAFIGAKPEGMEACHCNGNREDNRVSNLRWDTRKANHADKKLHGTARIGAAHPQAKLDDVKIRCIRIFHKCGVSVSMVMDKYNISRMTHWRIVNRKAWTHIQDAPTWPN